MKIIDKIPKIAAISFVFTLFSCDCQYDNTVYEAEFNKMPGNVSNLHQTVDYETQSITLSWDIKNCSNADKIVLTAWTDETCRTMNTNAGNLSQQKRIPLQGSYTVSNLTLSKDYFFSVQTENKTGKISSKQMISYSPIEHNSLVTYKLNETAYDFGYQNGPKEVDIVYVSDSEQTIAVSPANSSIEMVSPASTGSYQLISFDKSSVSRGEKVTIRVRYTPGTYNNSAATASWDEAYLYISNSISPKPYIKLLGSNFPQPANIGSDSNGSHLKLWLRPEFISKSSVVYGTGADEGTVFVKKITDYSGHNFPALPKDDELNSCPTYEAGTFNTTNSLFSSSMPGVYIGTKEHYLEATGNISSSLYGGSTGFIVFKRKVLSNPVPVQAQRDTTVYYGCYLACSNIQDYTFPTIQAKYLSYDLTGTKGFGTGSTYPGPTYRAPSFMVADNGMIAGTNRFLFDADTPDGQEPVLRGPRSVLQGKTYVACSVLDTAKTTHTRDSNLYGYLNGKQMLVSYTYSRESEPDSSKLQWASGFPWSDGKNSLNKIYRTPEELNNQSKTVIYSEGVPYDSAAAESKYFSYMLHPENFVSKFTNYSGRDFALEWFANKNIRGIDTTDYSKYYANDITIDGNNYNNRAAIINHVYIGSKPQWSSYTPITQNSEAEAKHYDANVYVADVIIYDKPLTPEEIQSVNNYLTYRFGCED